MATVNNNLSLINENINDFGRDTDVSTTMQKIWIVQSRLYFSICIKTNKQKIKNNLIIKINLLPSLIYAVIAQSCRSNQKLHPLREQLCLTYALDTPYTHYFQRFVPYGTDKIKERVKQVSTLSTEIKKLSKTKMKQLFKQ